MTYAVIRRYFAPMISVAWWMSISLRRRTIRSVARPAPIFGSGMRIRLAIRVLWWDAMRG